MEMNNGSVEESYKALGGQHFSSGQQSCFGQLSSSGQQLCIGQESCVGQRLGIGHQSHDGQQSHNGQQSCMDQQLGIGQQSNISQQPSIGHQSSTTGQLSYLRRQRSLDPPYGDLSGPSKGQVKSESLDYLTQCYVPKQLKSAKCRALMGHYL